MLSGATRDYRRLDTASRDVGISPPVDRSIAPCRRRRQLNIPGFDFSFRAKESVADSGSDMLVNASGGV